MLGNIIDVLISEDNVTDKMQRKVCSLILDRKPTRLHVFYKQVKSLISRRCGCGDEKYFTDCCISLGIVDLNDLWMKRGSVLKILEDHIGYSIEEEIDELRKGNNRELKQQAVTAKERKRVRQELSIKTLLIPQVRENIFEEYCKDLHTILPFYIKLAKKAIVFPGHPTRPLTKFQLKSKFPSMSYEDIIREERRLFNLYKAECGMYTKGMDYEIIAEKTVDYVDETDDIIITEEDLERLKEIM